MSLQEAINQEEKLWHETKAQLQREVLDLREKLTSAITRCADLVKTQAHHPKFCRCLNCRDLVAIKQQILALRP
jgi:hypothetical protein